jgi:hypothetical protein
VRHLSSAYCSSCDLRSSAIHGELLELRFEVAQSSVAKYMVRRRRSPSQGWRTFLHNHAPDVAAMDLFVVPTIGFDLLYAFVIVRLGRRNLVWINVTSNPTAEWIARQITQAFPWDEAPKYLLRDRDRIYGNCVIRRMRAMGIRDKPIAPASPWRNGFAERLIGSIRRECVDHFIVLGEVPTLTTIMTSEHIGRWARMHRFPARFSGPGLLNHMRSLADFITTTSVSGFSAHTGLWEVTARRYGLVNTDTCLLLNRLIHVTIWGSKSPIMRATIHFRSEGTSSLSIGRWLDQSAAVLIRLMTDYGMATGICRSQRRRADRKQDSKDACK